MLRRTKDMKNQHGTELLDLPKKTTIIKYIEFSEPEKKLYNTVLGESQKYFHDLARLGLVFKNQIGILEKLLRLRQICCHQDIFIQKKVDFRSFEDIIGDFSQFQQLQHSKEYVDT